MKQGVSWLEREADPEGGAGLAVPRLDLLEGFGPIGEVDDRPELREWETMREIPVPLEPAQQEVEPQTPACPQVLKPVVLAVERAELHELH